MSATVAIANHSWFPIAWLMFQERTPLELREDDDYRLVMSIGSRSQVEHSYLFNCRQRGYYQVGPLSINSGDLFGFARSEWRETESQAHPCLSTNCVACTTWFAQPNTLWTIGCPQSPV